MAKTKKTTNAKNEIAAMKTTDELSSALLATQSELVEAKRSHASRELSNTQRLKELRVKIARIKTAHNSAEKAKEKA